MRSISYYQSVRRTITAVLDSFVYPRKTPGRNVKKVQTSPQAEAPLSFLSHKTCRIFHSYFMWHAFIVISHVNKMRFLYSFLLVIYIYIELASARAVSGGVIMPGDYGQISSPLCRLIKEAAQKKEDRCSHAEPVFITKEVHILLLESHLVSLLSSLPHPASPNAGATITLWTFTSQAFNKSRWVASNRSRSAIGFICRDQASESR